MISGRPNPETMRLVSRKRNDILLDSTGKAVPGEFEVWEEIEPKGIVRTRVFNFIRGVDAVTN